MSGNVNFIGTQEEWDALVEKNKLRLSAMKKKFTAVEWMVEQLAYHYSSININNTVIFEDAKAMINEQIEEAYRAGYTDCSLDRFSDSEKYFNETFNNTQS